MYKWRLNVNYDKTKAVRFRKKSVLRSCCSFQLWDVPIAYNSIYRYLGLCLDEHMDMMQQVRNYVNQQVEPCLLCTQSVCMQEECHMMFFTKLYRSLVVPVLLYGASIWGIYKYREVEIVQN